MIDSPLDDGIERPYICPCGKSYLSYPALFTHVKQKHNGNVAHSLSSPPEKSSGPKPPTKEAGPAKMLINSLKSRDPLQFVCLLLYRTKNKPRPLQPPQ